MITITHTAEYDYPASAVFAALTDFPAYPRWQRDVVRAAQPAGPPAVGARIEQVRTVMGHHSEVVLTITEYEPAVSLVLQTEDGAEPSVRQSYRLESVGDRSALTFQLNLDGVPNMAQQLVKIQLSHQVQKIFADLNAVIADRRATGA